MTTPVDPSIWKPEERVTESARRRWRLAALLGLVVLLLMAAFAIVQTRQQAEANRTTAVLKAASEIRAGAVIADRSLAVVHLRVDDPAVVANLVDARDRGRLVGQVATGTVPAGGLIPAGLGTPASTVGMWDVPLPVKRMPGDLRAGDHVALMVEATARSGGPTEIVALQDVRVIGVHPGSVDLWLPAAAAAQMEWYADHGSGIAVARMHPGAVQQNLRPGGAS